MKINFSSNQSLILSILALFMLLFSSCSTSYYLPKPAEIDIYPYGSLIKIQHKTQGKLSGELIALDKNEIIILTNRERTGLKIPLEDIKSFRLKYARANNYSWTIAAGTVLALSHGAIALFTLPINWATTIAVVISAENDFQYKNTDITYEQLQMFARFPQGLPEHIDLSNIK